MGQLFDITTVSTMVAIEDRRGRASFTVTNATDASIGGDAVIFLEPGATAKDDWFTVDDPSRVYSVDQSQQIAVDIDPPDDVPAGTYRFKLRVLLGGGVPEEQFDDSLEVSFTVKDEPLPPPTPEPDPKKPFPWWIVAVIGGIIALIVTAVVAYFVIFGGDDDGQLVFKTARNGEGDTVCTLDVKEGEVRFDGEDCADDAASSVILEAVSKDFTIGVYNDAECTEARPWTSIVVENEIDEVTIPTFHANMAAPPVTVTFHSDNPGLAIPVGTIITTVNLADLPTTLTVIREMRVAGITYLAFESILRRDLALRDPMVESAAEKGMTLWHVPWVPDQDRLDGRVSCVKIEKS